MYDVEFTIREPKRPLLNKIIFAIAFSGFFTFIIYLFSSNDFSSEDTLSVSIYLLWSFCFLFVFLTPIIARHYIHFNFSNLKIRHSYAIGCFKYNETWQNLDDLKYISVFHTSKGYEINMWYKKRNILNLAVLQDSKEAIEKGLYFSEHLKIDLLDARERGDYKWVDKEKSNTLGKIIHSS